MLSNLNIKNYALIDYLSINFSDSFTVISGDTGSGKSIILDAISFLLGSRIDKKKLNEKKCVIEASFSINDELKPLFANNDLDFDNNTIIRREINSSGKIRNFINDSPVTANILSTISSAFIEIHAQHHNLLIKNRKEQLSVIDKLANNNIQINEYNNVLNQYNSLKKELENFNKKEKLSDDDYQLFKFHFQEINQANIKDNEDVELEYEINLHENVNHILEITKTSNFLISEENHILDYLNRIKQLFAKYDQFNELSLRIDSSIIDLNDISDELSNIYDKFSSSDINLNEKLDRFNLINKILNKHSLNSSSELPSFSANLKSEIELYENFEIEKKQIHKKISELKEKLLKKAGSLTKSRNKIIPGFEKEVIRILKTLGMPHALFKVELNTLKDFSLNGIDEVIFKFSSNPGVVAQDISKIASGGEISRLVLALKYITSAKSEIKTIIFDEIDTGVSGKIASYMGDLMRTISSKNQLISVTHLPQIASKSNDHIKVFKTVNNNITRTDIKVLENEERVLEIARLLSGKQISDAAITNAKELLNQ